MTSDRYTASTTLSCDEAERVNMFVSGAAIFFQWALSSDPSHLPAFDAPEEFYAPGKYSFDLRCDAVRVRSAVPATPAQVSISTRTADDLGVAARG
jgi:hypothetical protein